MNLRQISVLRHHGFGLLAASTLLSRFGDILAGLGFLYLAYRMTGSQSATTAVAVAEVIPYLLFGLLGGVLSDSMPKLRVMKGANYYRAVLETLTVILLLTGAMSYVAIVVLPFLIQLGGVIYTLRIFVMVYSHDCLLVGPLSSWCVYMNKPHYRG